jgi:hypothetical protein
MERNRDAPLAAWLQYRVPRDIVLYPYAWNGKTLRPIATRHRGRNPLVNDNEWHRLVLDPAQLRNGERFAIAYNGDEGYLCAGIGGNRLGASYRLQMHSVAPLTEEARVIVSSTHREWPGEGPPEAIIDGDPNTRWSSDYETGQEVRIDLGKEMPLTALRVLWEKSAARRYGISVSPDGESWRTVMEKRDGAVGPRLDEVELGGIRARHLRLDLLERTTEFGFSVYEIEIVQ